MVAEEGVVGAAIGDVKSGVGGYEMCLLSGTASGGELPTVCWDV